MKESTEMSTGRRDRYGGCTCIEFEATGYFRLEHDDGWWLVTPEGHTFLSLRLSHVVLGWNDKYGDGPPLLRPETRAFWVSRSGVDEDAGPEAFLPRFEEKVTRNGQSSEGSGDVRD